jgi:hypothetical protein
LLSIHAVGLEEMSRFHIGIIEPTASTRLAAPFIFRSRAPFSREVTGNRRFEDWLISRDYLA